MLVPFLEYGGEECILLTKRPEGLVRYAGHVSFPGGARDPGDATLVETALREAEEEVGLPRSAVEVIRELPWQETALHHRVKPFVGRVKGPFEARPDPREVECVLYLPSALLRPELFHVRGVFRDPAGRERPVYTFQLSGFEVWGLTARILRELVPGLGADRGS